MSSHDLFALESGILHAARDLGSQPDLPAETYRDALLTLTDHYQRLMRESRRLISHSDRAERELNRLNEQLQELASALEYKATHDPLTNIFNRGAIIERISSALKRSPITLIVLDIDHFKRINDEFGHPTGDAVICEMVSRIQHEIGSDGDIGRVGGEEFTILLEAMELPSALELVQRIHIDLNHRPLTALPLRPVTASFGVSCCPQGVNFEEAYGCADAALYEAKRNGRNRICQKNV